MQSIKTGIASFGMSGLVFHGPLLQANAGFQLDVIVERSRNESSKIYPEARVVRSFEQLCKEDSIELIIVNTPDPTHYDFCKMALEHGKHVVVEKPFTQAYSQAMELAELAERKGLVLSVFQNRRWDGDFLTVQKVIHEKMLGRLVFFEAHFDRYRNFIQEGTWKEDSSTGTGTLYNLGSHLIDQALVLFGKPHSVIADIRAFRQGSSIDDTFELWLNYDDVKVSVCGSYLVREPGPRYILHGTEGSFLKWGIDPQEEALKKGQLPGGPDWGEDNPDDYGLLNTTLKGQDVRQKVTTLPGNYLAYYNNIYDVIRQKDTLAVTAQQAAFSIRVIEAAFESMRLKKAIKL